MLSLRRLIIGLVAVLLGGSLLFSGCEKLPSPGSQITPPRVVDQDRRPLTDAEVREFLPVGARLLDNESFESIQTYDFDRNGRPEILAAYQLGERSVGVLLLREKSGEWKEVWQEDVGYNLDHLELADITGDGRLDVLVGGSIGASAGNSLHIYSWQERGELREIARTGYHRLEVLDLAGPYGFDGKAKLAVWSRDTGDTFVVDILRWDGLGLEAAEDLYAAYFPTVVEYYTQKINETPAAAYYLYYLADAQVKVGDFKGAGLCCQRLAVIEPPGLPGTGTLPAGSGPRPEGPW